MEELQVAKAGLVVFSHLRWDFVFQRPQHLLSRFAINRPVIFIEEPVLDSEREAHLEQIQVNEQLLVLRPHTPLSSPGFAEDQIPILQKLLYDFFQKQVDSFVGWFYTPLALPLLEVVPHSLVVYDCMDALDAFLNAPELLKQREEELLEISDLVFTGGSSLYQRLKGRHDNVHCFPSSVDAKHFASAVVSGEEPGDQRDLPHPRLGYFGVIDERIDLELIDVLAKFDPSWQIVMVGPVVKIAKESLPQHNNVHYLGQKAYAELPSYLAGWDICLLPFAMNESTKYISPTKTLEYMAAKKKIVSTPVTDVKQHYSHVVSVQSDRQAFAVSCRELLNESSEATAARSAGMQRVLASTSWDLTVERMATLIDEALLIDGPKRVLTSSRPRKDRPVVVIGAGPTGLSAAYHLGESAILVEQNDKVGGWCRSLTSDGFTFDFAGHIMFSNDPYVHQLYEMLLGDNVHWQNREAWVYSKQAYTRYPFQAALYGLPAEVIKECIIGAIEAKYGSIAEGNTSSAPSPNGTTASTSTTPLKSSAVCEGDVKDCCGDGVMESTAKLGKAASSSKATASNGSAHSGPANFEEFIYKVWGKGIAKHFAVPYNRKLWAVPLSEMETSWLGGRVPMPDLGEMIEGALQPLAKPLGPNSRFGYPLRGGFQALMDGFLPHLDGRLLLGRRVAAVSARARQVTLSDGTILHYEQLVSTMPLPVLIKMLGNEVPEAVRRAAGGLRHVSVRCVNLGIGREALTEKHWIYYPEETVFHRIFVQGNASPHCNPPGGFGLTCEITYSPHKPLPCDGQELIQRCIDDCRSVGMIGDDDPIWTANQIDMPYAYVVYDHARPQNVATIRQWLESQDIYLAGRYSEWEYFNSDHAFIAGKKIAEMIQENRDRSESTAVQQLVPNAMTQTGNASSEFSSTALIGQRQPSTLIP